MSKKNRAQQQQPDILEDFGGLDLSGACGRISEETDVVVSDGQAPPDVQLTITLPAIETPPGPPFVQEGFPLLEALERSPYLYMAAAPTPNPDFVVVTKGTFVWVATAQGLMPAAYSWEGFNQESLREQKIWFPVWGNEGGLYVNKTSQK